MKKYEPPERRKSSNKCMPSPWSASDSMRSPAASPIPPSNSSTRSNDRYSRDPRNQIFKADGKEFKREIKYE
ncbi:hypothetical protein WR25_02610 [Diploscapter pachys]|uniref:Uncharacterized protein n=1 Tax=Diploscapter pachys TaxID=2018661 RepID=A0A2A2LA05_9BILA|nr:hypothetical protein WR25_02610 [Diploscapter pachys]